IRAVNGAAEAEAKRITGRTVTFLFGGDDKPDNVQLAREYAEGILQGMERVPETELRLVQTGPRRGGVFADKHINGEVITFNSELESEPARVAMGLSERNHFLITGTPTGVAVHEYGHTVGSSHDLHYEAAIEVADFRNELWHAGEDRFDTTELISQRITSYAATDEWELTAEAFADVVLHGDQASVLSRRIYNRMIGVITGTRKRTFPKLPPGSRSE